MALNLKLLSEQIFKLECPKKDAENSRKSANYSILNSAVPMFGILGNPNAMR